MVHHAPGVPSSSLAFDSRLSTSTHWKHALTSERRPVAVGLLGPERRAWCDSQRERDARYLRPPFHRGRGTGSPASLRWWVAGDISAMCPGSGGGVDAFH